MFSRFDTWQYRDDNNCWDFVREFLIDKGVPPKDVPKYGISPNDKRGMTKASIGVKRLFNPSSPVQNAIACHYHGGVLMHVGIVDNGKVRHTGSKTGTRIDTIESFEKMAETKYFLHRKWQ